VLTENIEGREAIINARLNSVEAPDIEAAQHLHCQVFASFGAEPENRWTNTRPPIEVFRQTPLKEGHHSITIDALSRHMSSGLC
jgi:hypothetical protein